MGIEVLPPDDGAKGSGDAPVDHAEAVFKTTDDVMGAMTYTARVRFKTWIPINPSDYGEQEGMEYLAVKTRATTMIHSDLTRTWLNRVWGKTVLTHDTWKQLCDTLRRRGGRRRTR